MKGGSLESGFYLIQTRFQSHLPKLRSNKEGQRCNQDVNVDSTLSLLFIATVLEIDDDPLKVQIRIASLE